jgi:hypothetical protein
MGRVLTRLERARRRLERACNRLISIRPEDYRDISRYLHAQAVAINTVRRRQREYLAVEAGRPPADWTEFRLEG